MSSGSKKRASGLKSVEKKEKVVSKKKILARVKKGDFVYIDYIGIVKETGEVFDTTLEEEAKKAGIYKEDVSYEPILTIVGEKWVVEGLDESLIGRSENEYFEVEISPEKGFGRRDSKKIVTTTIRKLRRSGLEGDVKPGMVIQVNGVPAIVKAVVSGRVMLDFNPPLAGKHLIYKVWIRKILKTTSEKIKAIIKKHSREISDSASLSIRQGVVEINLGKITLENPRLGFAKKKIVEDILRYIGNIKKVRFIEEFSREEKVKAAKESKGVQPQQG